ncbi:NAD(P)/FAD-dependent oxidoreductase [Cryomorpha ignava]|uniref:NADH:ubiquinone reductase (non-electrogenic) n=1 Tax=Cryomorpha ignava TaxID=101383 RepID=A0A7K3WQW6_9FLAO|nr:NAD(P)/FAD-dependent oxidoreductase [Cryomorpha ignava]NEN24079.1 NAD(P)/FAD-dependent oxidoreductase [Cryomorpha ignava]
MNISDTSLPRVVVVGGGFAGLKFCKNLRHDKFQIVLIDRHNYHTFQPLLYQVATAGLEPDSIAYPLRKIFNKIPNFYFRMTEVLEVFPEKKCLRTTIGELEYDHLVLATGTVTNFFGNEEIEKRAMGMKFVPEALNIRSLILQNFEAALLTDDLKERESLMNVVIVGGGPTGVELAGAIAELKKHVLPTDYPDLDFRRMSIHLVEGTERVLPPFSEEASKKALQYLETLGVNVWLNTMVKDYDGKTIVTSGKPMLTQTLIWAAGVKCQPLDGIPAANLVKGNRIKVNHFNQVEAYEGLYVLGDLAYMETKDFPKGHPQVAQPAIQQGKLLAKNLSSLVRGKAMKPFKYKDQGSLATIGRSRAVADLPHYKTQGTLAWFIWTFVHLIALVGFRNRVVVFFNWMINFFSYNRDIRLIIRPYKRKE